MYVCLPVRVHVLHAHKEQFLCHQKKVICLVKSGYVAGDNTKSLDFEICFMKCLGRCVLYKSISVIIYLNIIGEIYF